MTLHIITGNKNKVREITQMISDIKQLDIDLPEIQETDAKKVITAKLLEAQKHYDEEFKIEDTSLHIHALNGLPGPLIKWFLDSIGTQGIYKILSAYEDKSATATTYIGYSDSKGNLQFFSGKLEGKIVSPRGENGFGWDAIFQPSKAEKTFAEMTDTEKSKYNMRTIAIEKLKEYIDEVK